MANDASLQRETCFIAPANRILTSSCSSMGRPRFVRDDESRANHLSQLAWCWYTWGGYDAPITNYSGETNPWGTDVKVHLAHLTVPRLQTLQEPNSRTRTMALQGRLNPTWSPHPFQRPIDRLVLFVRCDRCQASCLAVRWPAL